MDQTGFTLLAMGFTGAKALKFKLRYIEAFNALEAEVRRIAPRSLAMRDARSAICGTAGRVASLGRRSSWSIDRILHSR